MKRRLLFMICFLMVTFLCACGQVESESVEETIVQAEDVSEELKESEIVEEDSEIEKLKVLVKMTEREGEYHEYEYDQQGNCIKDTKYVAGYFYNSIVYEYDENGNKIVERQYSDGNRIEMELFYSYDQNNNLVEKLETEYRKWTYEYNDNNQMIKESFYIYDLEFELSEYTVYEYGDDGKLINGERIFWDKVTDRYEYTYDSEGKLVLERWIVLDTMTEQKTEYVYDENGMLVEETVTGLSSYSIRYEYDEDGDIVKKQYYNLEGEPTSDATVYEYDYIDIEEVIN